MIAGPTGRVPVAFLLASAIAARKARFACSLRMQSAYSWLGGWLLEGSLGLFGPAFALSAPRFGDVGDCRLAGPALPCACRFITSCNRCELISRSVVTRSSSLAAPCELTAEACCGFALRALCSC